MAMRVKHHCVADWREAARAALPRFLFDYVEGGAGDEDGLRRSARAYQAWSILPRVLNDVSRRSCATTIFGEPLSMPVIVAPTGLNGAIRPNGDQLLAQAARDAGVPFVLSTAGNATLGEITKATSSAPWFQLYVVADELTKLHLQRATAAGCQVLVVTVDVPLAGRRLRDLRNELSFPVKPTAKLLGQLVSRPGWWGRYLAAERPDQLRMLQLTGMSIDPDTERRVLERRFDQSFDWQKLSRLRDLWPGTLMLKGVLHPSDAELALGAGIDGIVVSNHGGRQLNAAPTPIDMLPHIAAAVGARMTVLMDGGISSGEDILRATGLGAAAVLVGRAPLYGLAAGGAAGAQAVLELLKEELLEAMALAGVNRPQDAEVLRAPTEPPSLEPGARAIPLRTGT